MASFARPPAPSTVKTNDIPGFGTLRGQRTRPMDDNSDSPSKPAGSQPDDAMRRAMIMRDYHNQPFMDRNYGLVRGLNESTAVKWIRHESLSALAEVLGTFGFLFPSFLAAQNIVSAASRDGRDPGTAEVFYIAFSFGLALLIQVFIWYRVSGGQFNPAVTLALALLRCVSPIRFLVNVGAQIAGAIAAGLLAKAVTRGPFLVANGLPTIKLAASAADATGAARTTEAATSPLGATFVEAVITAGLVLTVLFLAVEKHRATPMAPLMVGLSIVVAHLAAVPLTSCGANPARTLGTIAAMGKFPTHGWVFFLGPCLGAIISTALFVLFKWAGYQDVNAGQDNIRPPKPQQVFIDESGATRDAESNFA